MNSANLFLSVKFFVTKTLFLLTPFY